MDIMRKLFKIGAGFSLLAAISCNADLPERKVERTDFSVDGIRHMVIMERVQNESNILATYPLGFELNKKVCFYSEGNENECPSSYQILPMTSKQYFLIKQELELEKNLRLQLTGNSQGP